MRCEKYRTRNRESTQMQTRLFLRCVVFAVLSGFLPAARAQDTTGAQRKAPSQFVTLCASCHGEQAHGTDRGPPLVESRKLRRLSEEEVRGVIRDGTDGGMPPFALENSALETLAGWVHSRNASAYDIQPPGNVRAGERFFFEKGQVGYPFDSGDHNILWLAIGGPRKGLPIAPRFQACDGHGACVILDRPETQPRGPIACRPASGAPGCILGAVCWRPWIDQTTTPRGYLSQVDTPLKDNVARVT